MHTTAIDTNAISTQLVDATPRSFDFGHFFALLFSKAWLIIFFAAVSLLAAGIYLKLATKFYESRTTVEVEDKSGLAKLTQEQYALEGELLERQANLTKAKADRDSALMELEADERLAQRGLISALDFKKAQIAANELSTNYEVEKQRYETQRINNVQAFDAGNNGGNVNLDVDIKTAEQDIQSDTLLLGVLKSNGLEKDPSFAPPTKDGSAYLDSELVARFRSRVKAAVRRGTRLIDLSVRDTDPKRAQQLAEAIVKAFIDQNRGESHANNRLRQEADRLKAKLQDAEQAVQKYREDHGSVALENNQNKQEQKALELNQTTVPYNALVREVETDRALYESVVTRMKVTDIADGISGKNIRVVATPLVTAKPVEPAPLKTLLLALLVGVVVGCGLVVSIDMADNSIRSADEAEIFLGFPVLAQLPESKRKTLKSESALTSDPASLEAEAFRSLRASLSLLGQEKSVQTILFTSANQGEGKTYCCLNYAVALAEAGFRTLLIDADLRQRNLSTLMLLNTRAQGLSSCLSRHATITDCSRPTGIENLFILGAGWPASKPAELLASSQFADLLQDGLVQFDRIVIDSAPINPVSDTQLIAKYVQSVCLILRAGETPRRAILRACSRLAKANRYPDGIVFNRMTRASRDSYYSPEYGHAYGHPNRNGAKISLVQKLLTHSEENS